MGDVCAGFPSPWGGSQVDLDPQTAACKVCTWSPFRERLAGGRFTCSLCTEFCWTPGECCAPAGNCFFVCYTVVILWMQTPLAFRAR